MSKPSQKMQDPGWGELIEDAIGVNLQGLKTLWTSLAAPAHLFIAARAVDWQGHKYSPTLRVWLFLIAIMMFLQFIWAKPDSFLGQQMELAFTSDQSEDPIMQSPETLDLALQRYVFIYPTVLLLLTIITALLLRIWGKGTTSVTRIRLYFAATLPGALVTLGSTPLLAFISIDKAAEYSILWFTVIFLADFLTTWRGLAPANKMSARSWRAALLAITNQFVYVSASSIAAIIMVLWLAQDLGFKTILSPG